MRAFIVLLIAALCLSTQARLNATRVITEFAYELGFNEEQQDNLHKCYEQIRSIKNITSDPIALTIVNSILNSSVDARELVNVFNHFVQTHIDHCARFLLFDYPHAVRKETLQQVIDYLPRGFNNYGPKIISLATLLFDHIKDEQSFEVGQVAGYISKLLPDGIYRGDYYMPDFGKIGNIASKAETDNPALGPEVFVTKVINVIIRELHLKPVVPSYKSEALATELKHFVMAIMEPLRKFMEAQTLFEKELAALNLVSAVAKNGSGLKKTVGDILAPYHIKENWARKTPSQKRQYVLHVIHNIGLEFETALYGPIFLTRAVKEGRANTAGLVLAELLKIFVQ